MSDLGAQYREARAAIGEHRIKQAEAERAYTAIYQDLVRRGERPVGAQLAEAQAAVDKAVADVEWCRALVVAAGEEFKGESFETVVARNQQTTSLALRERAIADLNRGDTWTAEGEG